MSTTGKEYKLAIRIAGVVDKSFNSSLTSTASSLAAFKATVSAIDSDFTKLDKGFNKIMGVGKKCFSAIATAAAVAATAIGAATAASISVGSNFESAFAGVKKTVEATDEEYEQLRQSILGMAREIPFAATEIAGVMEIAGQLGIANDSLTDFTETMINLGVSTNMSAEDAATSLAKFANIMSMDNYGEDGISNYERLGSTIVDLGNNFATTEADIVDISESLAAAGKLAGMSEADIMGISAAMSSVGLTSEAGASSMSRLIMQMQQSVAEGGDSLQQYAETAGMTAEEFTTAFKDDAAGAVVSFIEGLNTAGEDSYGILEDLELSTIRTRKAFLSLAGADDLMGNAIDMANEAWDENTALAIEAANRYETAESKVQLMKNAFSELGIVAYDELREPYVSVIEEITGKVQDMTEYVGSADGVSKWIKNISTALPTLQRKVKGAWSAVSPFFNGLMGVGKWFLQNPEVITSALIGIGTALGTYKVASEISHMVNALMSLTGLNPVTQGILAVVAAIGLLATAVSAYKQYEQNLIDENLASHFGNISLSMEELQRVAEYIVNSESLSTVKEALSAFDDLGSISSSIDAAVEDLNKMNWKVSIGMELTEDEQESYKTAIDEYVESVKDYALQSQYAVSLNLSVAFDEGDKEGQSVVDKVNQFYEDSYSELESLGTQLNEAVTEAFNDGLLEIDEAEKIASIQAQMAAIQKSLATGEFDAQLSLLQTKYAGGGSLSAESFQNLQSELSDQVTAATEAYEEAYVKAVASVNAAYDAGEYLTKSEYQSALDSLQQEYLQNTAETQAKSINFQLETIMGQYADELDPAIASYMETIKQTLSEYEEMGWDDWRFDVMLNDMIQEIAGSSTLSDDTKGAISQLLDGLAPTIEQMETLKQQCEEAGAQIPESIQEGLSTYNLLGALAADPGFWGNISDEELSAVGNTVGEQMFGDSFWESALSKMSENGMYITEGVAEGISNAAATAAAENVTAAADAACGPAAEGAYNSAQSAIDSNFAQGFNANADLNITLNPHITNYSAVSSYVSNATSGLSGSADIGHRAKGGLATSPELTWFAEESPEMAIPIDGSQNAISLWEQTGRLLGMDSALDSVDLNSSSSPAIEYKPTLQFYGEAPSKTDIQDALRISQDEFESLMERYLKTQGRVAFG